MPIEAAAAATIGEEARETFCMDERSFREFYANTAGKLRGYLLKVSGNPALADDLLQESYFRLLRAGFQPESEDHRKNYLFRIATNLLRDHFRRARRWNCRKRSRVKKNWGRRSASEKILGA